jgi:serine/threonine-protein kinase HipA
MNLLAVTSTPAAGRVWASAPDYDAKAPLETVALRDILAHRGAEELFDELLEKYADTPISGVQPKVTVPEEPRASAPNLEKSGKQPGAIAKSSIKSPDLIVKAAGGDYPDLAENEYICMSIARHAGLETPDFWLSDDRKLFVIRRFDVSTAGYLGFEDMAVLTGRHPSKKYEGSYSDIARAIIDFAAPAHRNSSIEAFFRLMVVNCLIRNGDAHLKNFGILYGDPGTADRDARLAPVYDLVSSTVYIPNDVLALSLGGNKAWPDRKRLERFGKEICSLKNPATTIEELIERVTEYQYDDPDSVMWKKVEAQLKVGLNALRALRKFAPRPRAS